MIRIFIERVFCSSGSGRFHGSLILDILKVFISLIPFSLLGSADLISYLTTFWFSGWNYKFTLVFWKIQKEAQVRKKLQRLNFSIFLGMNDCLCICDSLRRILKLIWKFLSKFLIIYSDLAKKLSTQNTAPDYMRRLETNDPYAVVQAPSTSSLPAASTTSKMPAWVTPSM